MLFSSFTTFFRLSKKKKTRASFSTNQMQIKTNGDFATRVFPRLRSVTCVYFSFHWVFVIITFVWFAVEMDLVLLTVILFRIRKFYCWQNIQRDAKRKEKTGESVWPLDRPLTRKWSQSNRIYYNQHFPYFVLCTEIHCEEGEATRKVRGMGNWWWYPQDVSKET